jgi:predicted regulator of Ras-like GTPase activity (Roadblock/LC7/MglB family)
MLTALGGTISTDHAEPVERSPERRQRATARELKDLFVSRLGVGKGPVEPIERIQRMLRRCEECRATPEGKTMQQILEALRKDVAPTGDVALVAEDGLIVLAAGESPIEVFGVHVAQLMRSARSAAREDNWGQIREWTLETGTRRMIWRRVDDANGLVFTDAIDAPEAAGRVRYRLSVAAARLQKELSADRV